MWTTIRSFVFRQIKKHAIIIAFQYKIDYIKVYKRVQKYLKKTIMAIRRCKKRPSFKIKYIFLFLSSRQWLVLLWTQKCNERNEKKTYVSACCGSLSSYFVYDDLDIFSFKLTMLKRSKPYLLYPLWELEGALKTRPIYFFYPCSLTQTATGRFIVE